MSIAPVEIKLELINEKVKFLGISNTNQDVPITIDYLPPIGDGEGFLGLELLVMSFAGCVSTGIVAILRKMGRSIAGYKMNITGIKKENPLSLEKIYFEITVDSIDTTLDDLKKVVEKAEEISPVWLAVKNNVEVEWQCKLASE